MIDIKQSTIDTFHQDGAVLIKGILEPKWLDLIESGLEWAEANPDGMSTGVDRPLRIDQFPARQSEALADAMRDSPIAEIVGTVLGSSVRFYMDQMFYKPAGLIAPSAWHQDTCYYNVTGHDLVRAWVCVDPVPRDASLEVVRGSHLWNVTYRPPVGKDPASDPESAAQTDAAHQRGERLIGKDAFENWTYFDSFSDPSLPPLPNIEDARGSFDILGWDYEPGDVILFHGHILHGARGGIESTTGRRAHASLWAGSDVHYLHRRGQIIPDPVALYRHEPRSGQLLTDFPDVFPTLWSPN